MHQLSDQAVTAFELGVYETVLSELGRPELPVYLHDGHLAGDVPDERERLQTTLSYALINVAEHHLRLPRSARKLMDGPYWDCQSHYDRGILNLGLSFGQPDHHEDVPAGRMLDAISATRAGKALLFETALQLLSLEYNGEALRISERLSERQKATVHGLLALASAQGLPRGALPVPETELRHPAVQTLYAFLTRRVFLVEVLRSEISENGQELRSAGRLRAQHLALTLALLRDGPLTREHIHAEVMPEASLGLVGQVIYGLRLMLGKDAVLTDRDGRYRLGGIQVETDLDVLKCRAASAPLSVLTTLAAGITGDLEHVPYVQAQAALIARKAVSHLSSGEFDQGYRLVLQLRERVLALADDADRLLARLKTQN